ncbi:RnfABCDGE type electron transport complex subunit G [Parablautia intestinalis]|uniref:Ion-translocating oxidoreductase complex subunit G n=1 Tax=Parablautia intestinalis TaxID=2320100 RepID=A0A3A9AGS8_9FIRM|nr:RnfABCDGE type electron transport complex subunit G [Parablautia intestinalis]RKI90692.1 RnfABCDGE type electron transport complex subunit G [Parablautia intestinalis]
MKNMIKDAAILLVITLFSGLILGLVYGITKEPIALAEERAAKEAYAEVFPSAGEFQEQEVTSMEEESWKTEWAEAGFEGVDIEKSLAALDESGNVLGYVLTVTSHEGYGGDITFTMGISLDGTLNGISILSISETAGLGMKAEDVLKPQFAGKNVPGFTYTKTGAVSESQIDAISGATITTNAVTTAVNGGLYYFQSQLGGGSNEAE